VRKREEKVGGTLKKKLAILSQIAGCFCDEDSFLSIVKSFQQAWMCSLPLSLSIPFN